MSSPFSPAWLSGNSRARSLLPFGGDPARHLSSVWSAAERSVTPALLAELRAQQEDLPQNAARTRSLDALAERGTVCVITGQQVGLFGGPLYAVYKAASAVAAAQALAKASAHAVVPVFWLQ